MSSQSTEWTAEYRNYLETVVLRLHLEPLPEASVRASFLDRLTRTAAASDPPFSLDYWRLNLAGRRPGPDRS